MKVHISLGVLLALSLLLLSCSPPLPQADTTNPAGKSA